jgi:tetratricopeptide (TPR) repeat protein
VPLTASQRRPLGTERCVRPTAAIAAAAALGLALCSPAAGAAAPAADTAPDLAPEDGETDTNAEPPDSLERAMSAYNRGQEHYKGARYKEALVAFKEAATLYASPDFQYNIARCYEKLERYDEAVLAYETYLSTKPDAADRSDVEASIEFLNGKIEQAEARQRQQSEAAVVTTTTAEEPKDEPDQPKPDKPFILAGAIIGGVGAAVGLGGGIGFGVAARNRSDDVFFVQEEGNPDDLTRDETETLADEGKRFETLQIATAVAGGVLAVTGVALLVVGLRNKKYNASLRASLVPQLGPGQAGLTLTGRF